MYVGTLVEIMQEGFADNLKQKATGAANRFAQTKVGGAMVKAARPIARKIGPKPEITHDTKVLGTGKEGFNKLPPAIQAQFRSQGVHE